LESLFTDSSNGLHKYPEFDIVVFRFPDKEAVNGLYSIPAYQTHTPLREQAAGMVVLIYEA
jgi:uncharacterized protein (DUF1330 family)